MRQVAYPSELDIDPKSEEFNSVRFCFFMHRGRFWLGFRINFVPPPA
jgi:hypothetical protein